MLDSLLQENLRTFNNWTIHILAHGLHVGLNHQEGVVPQYSDLQQKVSLL